MNYFSHGRKYVDQPYFLAGTAVPDWLSVVNRESRARTRLAAPFIDDEDPSIAAVARGIVQHHHDDQWFHGTRAFAELSLQFTISIRDLLPDDEGFRPSFLGHILVEVLLDAALIEDQPLALDAYYQAMDSLKPEIVFRAVNRMTTKPADMLAVFIQRFCRERFLYDYADDEKLLWRLNHVMRRVRLSRLPKHLSEFFPAARQDVRSRRLDLLQEGVNDL